MRLLFYNMNYASYRYEGNEDLGTGVNRFSGVGTSDFYPVLFSLTNGMVIIPSAKEVREKETKLIPKYDGGYFKIIEVINETTGENLGEVDTLYGLGTYTATYSGTLRPIGETVPSTYLKVTYTFSIIENHKPLKKWTITDMINRIFDTVVPLFKGQKPKFRLSGVIYDENGNPTSDYIEGSTAYKLNKILAPEMTFTKMTLREMLKQVGGFIHGEPRITKIHNEESQLWYEVDFDFYGGYVYSDISKKKYVSATFKTDINEFCTSLDSSANNLVNRLDWASGVIVEPFVGGRRSLRTETTTVRLEDNNSSFIATDIEIDTIYKLEYIDSDGNATDITAGIFESKNYDNLSSYDETYPYSKSYAIYYTYGQKNIKGLFFKNEAAILQSFKKYAIVNVIELFGGNIALGIFNDNYSSYMNLSFRVTYLPIFSQRIRTNKQTIIGGIPRTLAYNQGANLIETRYYGENLKGAIARMGNVEKTYTYNLAFLSDIPKVGTLYDDNYYISTVNTEFLPSYIRCTIGLSKDFNRLSEYVGISSEKRMWEISERQAFSRDTIINNMVVVSENENFEFSDSNSILNTNLAFAKVLFNTRSSENNFVSVSRIRPYTKKLNRVGNDTISLPVLSVAMGNSMLFTIKLEDNYSAGQKVVPLSKNNAITGYWGAYVPYNDYYGRFYYLGIDMKFSAFSVSTGSPNLNFPDVNIVGGANLLSPGIYIKYRKDSREIPTITVEINTVTDNPTIVIGSALSKNCSLVNQNPKKYQLYVFNRRINTIDSTVDFDGATLIEEGFTVNENSIVLPKVINEHKSWAIVTERIVTPLEVEDDDGEIITQYIEDGGELVLGQNVTLENGKTLYFHIGRDAYD